MQAQLLLASRSPRRRELLSQIGLAWELLDVAVDERHHPGEAPADYVTRVARDKARAGLAARPRPLPVLAADTAVVVAERILGKPRDRRHGLEMLRALAGRSHEVLTAVCVADGTREEAALARTRVHFRAIDERELADYWASGEPADKAGGYAIQGRAAVFVRAIEGSYSGVVGLPLFETAQLLQGFGVACPGPR